MDKEFEALKAQLQMERETHKAKLTKELEQYRAEWRARLENWKVTTMPDSIEFVKIFRGVIRFAELAIRGLILISVGGAIAIIAFLGHIWTGNAALAPATAVALAGPLSMYVGGVRFSLLTAMFSYLSQATFAERHKRWKAQWVGNIFRVIAVVSVFAGFAAFVAGSMEAVEVFKSAPALMPMN